MLLRTQHGYGAQNVIKYTTFLQKKIVKIVVSSLKQFT